MRREEIMDQARISGYAVFEGKRLPIGMIDGTMDNADQTLYIGHPLPSGGGQVNEVRLRCEDVDMPRLREIIAGDMPFVISQDADDLADVAVFRARDDWAAYEVGKWARIDNDGYGFLADIMRMGIDELRALDNDHLYVAKLGRRITSLEQIIKEKS